MTLRLPTYSLWYPALVTLIWAYPLSFVFAKGFWSFLYGDVLQLQPYTLKYFLGGGLLLLALFSGAAVLLNVTIWLIPLWRRAIRPHWTTHLAAFAAFWIFCGTSATILSRPYPYVPVPTEQEKTRPGDVSGNV